MTASPACRYVKEGRIWSLIRPLERAASLAMSILLLPLIAPVAVAIAVLSRRSPLVAHLRIGQYGVPFWTLKVRTMWPRSPSEKSIRLLFFSWPLKQNDPIMFHGQELSSLLSG